MEKPSNQQPQPPANPLQKVQYVLWLNGKLRMNLRKLYAVQREKNKLKHSVRISILEQCNSKVYTKKFSSEKVTKLTAICDFSSSQIVHIRLHE